MARLFISYRNSDTGAYAGRLAAHLTKFQFDAIFHDREAIGVGDDFADVIRRELSQCRILLVLIGPGWLDARDKAGERRLGQAADWVRRELALALDRTLLTAPIHVVPVLIDDAPLPPAEALPPDIAGLARLNTYDLSGRYFKRDADELGRLIEREIFAADRSGRVAGASSPMARQFLLMTLVPFVATIGTAALSTVLPGFPAWVSIVPGGMTVTAFSFWCYWLIAANGVRIGLVT